MHSKTARFSSGFLVLLVAISCGWFSDRACADLWSTGYYPGYRQGYYPPANIDFTALSHIIHFSIIPNADGTLNTGSQSLTPAFSTELVTRAHAANRQALICVGGAGSQAGFQGATSSAHQAAFIANVVGFMSTYGYDGVDIDWEPLDAADAPQYANFINSLRAALDGFSPRRLLTVATASQPALFASLQNQFDQVNLMTYDLAGAWPGWVTWFNAPIYDGGFRFPSTGQLIPSADGMMKSFIAAGVSRGKLSVGLAFYGDIWTHGAGTSTGGSLLPRQSWTTAPTVTAIAYFDLMSNYYQSNRYHWDTAAQAAYLSVTNPVAADDMFISYDDEHACQAKVSYARNLGLGGVMIWEIGQGYRSTQPSGQRDPLLQAMKQALLYKPRLMAIQRRDHDIQISFTSLPLALYRVSWTSNLAAVTWNTLTNNVPGTGGILVITDAGAATNMASRCYRVQTPP